MHGTIVAPDAQRVVRRHRDWTLKEHEVVISHWPDVATISRRLPHRTATAIRSFAGKCNLRREIHLWSASQDALLRKRVRERVPRRDIAAELKLTLLQVTNRMRYAGIRYEGKRPPSSTGNRLMDAVFARAHELNLSRRDLDEICNSGAVFQRWGPSRRIHLKHVRRAVEYLDGAFVVEWNATQ